METSMIFFAIFLDDVDDDSNLWYYYPQVGINIKPDKNGITMVELRKILRPIFESPEDFFIGIDSIDEDEKHDFYFDRLSFYNIE